jgi:K+-transporting ATPase ATPase C chain
MKNNILPAIKLTLVCIIVFAVIYPLTIWGIAYVIAPNHGNGEVVTQNGKVVGYALIGQSFTQDKYFNGRPSAVGYNAAGSGGSNKGPANPEYLASVKLAIDTFLLKNPSIKKSDIPVELVTASGSGLDPDISPKAALVQIPRIAKARNISEDKLSKLIRVHTQPPLFGFMGPAKINVLKLNISLDNLNSNKPE